ncbi:RHS repeat-associated core domain-containing protein, partial [Pseudomonas syringae]|uniref:RHS repeat-associated core domain-containing protein n=1 Tax=Pseudomonas syringae TaxID=317 RepID=UPI0018E63F1D
LRMLREESPGQSSLYLYEPGSYAPLARIDEKEGEVENKVYYFHTDQIGTPLEMTDAEGQIVWQAKYRPWGAIEKLVVNEVEQNLRFQGQYFDVETGLHYNTFRYYDPEIGRFITQDPIGLAGGLNLYQYAPSPIAWVDPLGLAVDPIAKLESRGYFGVQTTSGGGLNYSESNALYSKKPNINPIVEIQYTGDYDLDFETANREAGLNQKKTPSGHVWHHLDDYDPKTNRGTMQLVEQNAHSGISHKGGVSQYKAATGTPYIHPASKRIGKTSC